MSERKPVLRGARVALIYGPGNLAADYASALLRGIERGLLDLGARVATLNTALYREAIVRVGSRGPDARHDDDSPLVRGVVDFLEQTWADAPFDYCIGVFHDIYLTDRLVEVIQRRVRWSINYPLNLLDQPHRFHRAAAVCSETFCAEEAALEALRASSGRPVTYVPMAADPWIHRPIGAPPAVPRLLFVGSLYADRHLLLERCASEMGISIYGPGYDGRSVARGFARELLRNGTFVSPELMGRAVLRAYRRDERLVSDEEFVRLASTHGVSVGFSAVRQERTGALLHKVRLREYEATMSGLCHITKRLPEIERGFDVGREILVYDDEAQLPEILAGVRRGEHDFRAIGAAARRRAERDHTWTVRLAGAFADAR